MRNDSNEYTQTVMTNAKLPSYEDTVSVFNSSDDAVVNSRPDHIPASLPRDKVQPKPDEQSGDYPFSVGLINEGILAHCAVITTHPHYSYAKINNAWYRVLYDAPYVTTIISHVSDMSMIDHLEQYKCYFNLSGQYIGTMTGTKQYA